MQADLPLILQAINILIVPVAIYVVRIDRRMGQIDALSTVNQGRIDTIEKELKEVREQLYRIEYSRSSRHA